MRIQTILERTNLFVGLLPPAATGAVVCTLGGTALFFNSCGVPDRLRTGSKISLSSEQFRASLPNRSMLPVEALVVGCGI